MPAPPYAYDKLVFATGSRPVVPPIEGADLTNIFVYRTAEDLIAIREQARRSRSAAVIGGGLLGLEAARALQTLGVECHIAEYAPQLLCAQLDPTAGEMALRTIEELGMFVRLNARVERISATGTHRILHLAGKDEPPLVVDLVVIAAGVRPRHEVAQAAALRIAGNGGIDVNNRLQTSDDRIFAIGECASHKGVTYGLVAPGYRMAESLAGVLMGSSRVFEGADCSTRLKVLGLEVSVLGDYNQPGAVHTWKSTGTYRRIVLKRGRLIGASALGDWPEVRLMQDAVLNSRRVWPWQVERFVRHGRVWPIRNGTRSVENWPASATVCNCMNLSCGVLKRARDGGARTVEALARTTGASTLCGSCKPLLAELTGGAALGVRPGRGLSVAAFVVLFVAIGLLLLPAIPYSSTVQSLPYDVIWRDGIWKQVTGFTIVGLSCLGLMISLRKRWPRFRFGDFAAWRALHGALGATSLIVLIAHTGLRFGANLNLALMTAFVSANLLGALAGLTLRRRLTWVHVLLVWPLPVLVGIHILAVYYF